MIRKEEVYKIGRLGKPHGVKGEIAFHFDDDVFDRTDTDYLVLELDEILVPFFIDEYRFKNGSTALMLFDGITTQEQARELTGAEVYFPRRLSDSSDEDMTWAEIIGFTLTDKATGKAIGTLRAVDETTINTLFEVETADGKNLLIPASEEIINSVDAERKEIAVTLPDGLLDL